MIEFKYQHSLFFSEKVYVFEVAMERRCVFLIFTDQVESYQEPFSLRHEVLLRSTKGLTLYLSEWRIIPLLDGMEYSVPPNVSKCLLEMWTFLSLVEDLEYNSKKNKDVSNMDDAELKS